MSEHSVQTQETPPSQKTQQTRPSRLRRRLLVTTTVLVLVLVVLAGNAFEVDRRTAAASGSSIITIDGLGMNVVQDGPAQAPAVVLVHGLGGSTRWWDPIVSLLDKHYHVIRVDLLGFGRSAKPAGDDYSIPEQARRIGKILDNLGVRQATLVGHSTGGYVVSELARDRPGLVKGLVLMDTGPRTSAFVSSGLVGNLVSVPLIGQSLWRLQTDSLVRKAMSSAFSRPGYQIPQELVDDTRATTYHALHATDAASTHYLQDQTLPDRLRSFTQPLMVIFGQDDHRWHSSSIQDYRIDRGAQLHLLPGIGHSPMQEAPEQTAQLLLTFLRDS